MSYLEIITIIYLVVASIGCVWAGKNVFITPYDKEYKANKKRKNKPV